MPFNRFDNYPMSWHPVLPKGNAPLYRLLAQQLEQDIARTQSEIQDLKDGLSTVEEKARYEMGMVKPNELFIQIAR